MVSGCAYNQSHLPCLKIHTHKPFGYNGTVQCMSLFIVLFTLLYIYKEIKMRQRARSSHIVDMCIHTTETNMFKFPFFCMCRSHWTFKHNHNKKNETENEMLFYSSKFWISVKIFMFLFKISNCKTKIFVEWNKSISKKKSHFNITQQCKVWTEFRFWHIWNCDISTSTLYRIQRIE